MQQVTDGTFRSFISGAGGTGILMFTAPWAGPVNLVRPTFQDVAARFGNQITFGEFVVDDNPVTPLMLGVRALPSFLTFVDGNPARMVAGAVGAAILIEMVETLIGTEE
jgi:thioredoxin 1